MNGNIEEESYPGVSEASLSIEITTHCNSDCLHCFARAKNSQRSSLPVDLVREVVSEGYKTGYRHLHITGGEPLLWEGLFEILDHTSGIGYKAISINTNGKLLTDDINRRLASYHGLSISVSLDGPEASHDHLRGKGSYRRTVHGIEKALDAGIELIIFTTVYKRLLPDLPRFADDLYERFPTIKNLTLLELIRATDDVFVLSDDLLEPEDFVRLVVTVSLINLWGLKTDVLNDPLVNVASKLLDMPYIPRTLPLCREGNIIVMANRSIRLSHSSKDSFGKYEPGMIARVLASDQYRRAVAPDEATCPPCKYSEPCMENGMLRPSEWYGEPHPNMPYCKLLLDRVAP